MISFVQSFEKKIIIRKLSVSRIPEQKTDNIRDSDLVQTEVNLKNSEALRSTAKLSEKLEQSLQIS